MKITGILLVALLILVGCDTAEEPLREGIELIDGHEVMENEETGETIIFGGSVDEVDLLEEAIYFDVAGRAGLNWLRHFFIVDTTDMYVNMLYRSQTDGDFWIGEVAETLEALHKGEFLYQFRVEARNGRLMDLFRFDETLGISDEFSVLNEEEERHYREVAISYIQSFIFDASVPRSIELVESGENLLFEADVNMGWVLELTLERGTERLLRMETFYRPGSGGGG